MEHGVLSALMQPGSVDSVIELALTEAIQNAPEFRESLMTQNLDGDLVSLLGVPASSDGGTTFLAKEVSLCATRRRGEKDFLGAWRLTSERSGAARPSCRAALAYFGTEHFP